MHKRNRLYLLLPVVLLAILSTACKRHTPSNVLSRKEMTRVLVDYHLARAMANDLDNDQRYKAPLVVQGVFQKHHITQEIFDSSMVWYTRNPQELALIYGRVNVQLQERLTAESSAKSSPEALLAKASFSDPYPSGDSINLWRGASLLEMNRFLSSRREQFIIATDTAFYSSDAIEWNLRAHFLPDDKSKEKVLMYLMVRYSPDSVLISSRVIQQDGEYSLTIRNNSGREMRQIWGVLQYFPSDSTTRTHHRVWFDEFSLMRYRKQGHENAKHPNTPAPQVTEEKESKNILESDTLILTAPEIESLSSERANDLAQRKKRAADSTHRKRTFLPDSLKKDRLQSNP